MLGFFEVQWLGDFVAVIDNGDYGDTYVQTCWKAYIDSDGFSHPQSFTWTQIRDLRRDLTDQDIRDLLHPNAAIRVKDNRHNVWSGTDKAVLRLLCMRYDLKKRRKCMRRTPFPKRP